MFDVLLGGLVLSDVFGQASSHIFSPLCLLGDSFSGGYFEASLGMSGRIVALVDFICSCCSLFQ